MKFIITESQIVDMVFKRRFGRIDELVDKKMRYYPPCDYTYDPYYGFYDYYGDVRNAVIYEIVTDDLKLSWGDDMEKIDNFSESANEWMFEPFYDKVKGYFDGAMEKGCEE